MKPHALFPALALLATVICGTSNAQTYTLGYDQTSYTVNEGDTIDVDIILTEEISGAEVARLATGGDNGLFAFGARVDYSSPDGVNGATYSSFALGPDFNNDNVQVGNGLVVEANRVSFEGVEDFASDTDGEDGVNGRMISATIYEITLGTMSFNAGDRGSVTTLTLGDHIDPNAVPFLFADGSTPEIGFANPPGGGFSIVTVPEPGSVAFLAAFGLIGLSSRRRR